MQQGPRVTKVNAQTCYAGWTIIKAVAVTSKGGCCAGRLESFFGPVSVKTSDTGKRKEAPTKGKQGAAKKGKATGKAAGTGKKK